MKYTKKAIIFTGYLLLAAGALSMIMPFLWLVAVSFMKDSQIFSYPPSFIPHPFITDNYKHVFIKLPLLRFFINSLFTNFINIITYLFFVSIRFIKLLLTYLFTNVIMKKTNLGRNLYVIFYVFIQSN